jgi:hypothetical protein
MISDTLFEAREEIRTYLDDPAFAGTYEGAVRDKIETLVQMMEGVQRELDCPPSWPW